MSPVAALTITGAGMAAGMINTIVGSGSLITFPALLAFGYPPVTANISNNFGLVPGGITGTWGYRRELAQMRDRFLRLAPMSVVGGITGALLLLRLPEAAFGAIVPVLIGLALVLVVAGPRLQRAVAARHEQQVGKSGEHLRALNASVFGAGMYGGYFGAAQGVLMMGLLGVLVDESMQRLNALKNGLVTLVNLVAAAVFAVVAFGQVDWAAAGLIAIGSTIGGGLGARVGRRLPPTVLRGVIVVVGVIAIVRLLA